MKFSPFIAAVLAAVCLAQGALAGTPARLHQGSHGAAVSQLEQFLHANKRMDLYGGPIDGAFGPLAGAGLRSWQKLSGYPVTGSITTGSRQWNQLKREATVNRLPYGIDRRAVNGAKREGWSVDASKRTNMLYMLRYDPALKLVVVALSTPTSFGGCNSDGCFVTPNGAFAACRKGGADEISHEWRDAQGNWAKMPWAVYMYIGGRCSGTAVHYDPLGNSHQCVHVPVMNQAQYINQHIPYGALIVIHN